MRRSDEVILWFDNWIFSHWGSVMLAGGVLMVVSGLAGAFLTHTAASMCEEACHPLAHNMIDGECHCATATGWDRLEDE